MKPSSPPVAAVSRAEALFAVAAVRARVCPLCEAPAGQPCDPKPAADHLARWLDAYTAGQLSRAYMARTVGELIVIDTCSVVAVPAPRGGAR